GRAVTELPRRVAAPRVVRTRRRRRDHVREPCADRDDAAPARYTRHGHGCGVVIRRGAVAELTRLVVAPTRDRPVALQRRGERIPGGDRGDAAPRPETAHGHRRELIRRRGAVAELPRLVVAPRKHGAVA